jgi:transposase-like protein
MVQKAIKYIHCDSENVVKFGKNPKGTHRLRCNACGKTFQEEYVSNGAKPETKVLIVKMSLNGSGIRDISRVLGISANTGIFV